jgi:SpoIIAA-like
MSISMQHERDDVYRLEMSGLLRRADFAQCETALAQEMGRIGRVKLLFVLKNFEGWEPHADWNDLTFYVKHGGAIDRIAIVGDSRWRSEALMFAATGLRRAPVQFFAENELASAHAWLSA